MYSLLATRKAHDIDERAWMENVFRRMPEYELSKKTSNSHKYECN